MYSVEKAAAEIQYEVWITDNASSDGSVEYLGQRFPYVHFIRNTENAGFAKANNQAMEKCKGEYILCLNPDTLIPEDCLTGCLAFIRLDPGAGALGVRMIDGSGTFLPESKRSFPHPFGSLFKLVGLSRMYPTSKIFSTYSLGYLDEFTNHKVDVLAGAFMLLKRSLLLQLKGFDESFFMYGEDIDLSYRIRKAGYENYYFAGSTIIHFKGESTSKGSLNYVDMFYRAMNTFVRKHYAGRKASVFRFFLQTAISLRAIASIFSRLMLNTWKGRLNAAKQRNDAKDGKQTIVIATKAEYMEVVELLEKSGAAKGIMGRVAVNEEVEDALTNLDGFYTLVKSQQIKKVVFCNGVLSYSRIIDMVQRVPKNVSLRFHAIGSGSIVGSDSRETSGEYIA